MMENQGAAENFKTEVLIIQSDSSISLKKLNDEEITDEDRQNAANTKAERIKAEEEARREAAAKALAGDGGAIAEAPDE